MQRTGHDKGEAEKEIDTHERHVRPDCLRVSFGEETLFQLLQRARNRLHLLPPADKTMMYAKTG